jgi:hypothetical protein
MGALARAQHLSHATVRRVWWTPNVVQIETRCNNMHMDNMRVSFTRKSVTFDGQEHEVAAVLPALHFCNIL